MRRSDPGWASGRHGVAPHRPPPSTVSLLPWMIFEPIRAHLVSLRRECPPSGMAKRDSGDASRFPWDSPRKGVRETRDAGEVLALGLVVRTACRPCRRAERQRGRVGVPVPLKSASPRGSVAVAAFEPRYRSALVHRRRAPAAPNEPPTDAFRKARAVGSPGEGRSGREGNRSTCAAVAPSASVLKLEESPDAVSQLADLSAARAGMEAERPGLPL